MLIDMFFIVKKTDTSLRRSHNNVVEFLNLKNIEDLLGFQLRTSYVHLSK